MEYEQLKQMLSQVVPFNTYLGLEVTEIGPGTGTVRLPEDPRLMNHVQTQHAAGMFAAAEAASGAAMASTFADRMGQATPLAKSAQISYMKPARGPIDAKATLGEDAAAILGRLDADGKVEFPVHVSLEDGAGVKVAEMTVAWYVRTNR